MLCIDLYIFTTFFAFLLLSFFAFPSHAFLALSAHSTLQFSLRYSKSPFLVICFLICLRISQMHIWSYKLMIDQLGLLHYEVSLHVPLREQTVIYLNGWECKWVQWFNLSRSIDFKKHSHGDSVLAARMFRCMRSYMYGGGVSWLSWVNNDLLNGQKMNEWIVARQQYVELASGHLNARTNKSLMSFLVVSVSVRLCRSAPGCAYLVSHLT